MQPFARSIVETVRHPLLVLDANLRVVVANSSYYHTFGSVSSATEGQGFFEIDAGQWEQPRLRALLEDFIPRDDTFQDLEVETSGEFITSQSGSDDEAIVQAACDLYHPDAVASC
jgi:PAS domain-containing protein